MLADIAPRYKPKTSHDGKKMVEALLAKEESHAWEVQISMWAVWERGAGTPKNKIKAIGSIVKASLVKYRPGLEGSHDGADVCGRWGNCLVGMLLADCQSLLECDNLDAHLPSCLQVSSHC